MPRRAFRLAACLFLLSTGAGKAAEFFPLGFDVNIDINSDQLAVSEGGSVVVGGFQGLWRWTRSTGPQVLVPQTFGAGMSGDASVIVTVRLRPGESDDEPIKLTDGELEVLPSTRSVNYRYVHISQDGGTIWASADTSTGSSSLVRWTDDSITPFPVSRVYNQSLVQAVSANGEVVVGYHYPVPVEIPFRWTQQDGFQELPGFGRDEEETMALGVSSDGRWAVGRSEQGGQLTQYVGTRWDGLSLPERLPPADEGWGTTGLDVVADGSIVVGRLYLSDVVLEGFANIAAGIWTEETGLMVPLQDLLVSDYGLGDSLEGYHLTGVYDVTDDGRFMVGHAINPAGLDEAWLVDLGPPPFVSGDYSDNGTVEQADLDLVLLHWGADASAAPGTWTNDLPTGTIDQDELDGVLLNWGSTTADLGAASVPEPSGFALIAMSLGVIAGVASRRLQCQGVAMH